VLAVEGQARFRDFDDEHRSVGMAMTVRAPIATRHGNVRLGLRFVIELDRTLRPHQPTGWESSPERVVDQAEGGSVGAVLGLAHDQLAAQELDGLARAEDADLDQTFVFRARPAPLSNRIRRHAGDATSDRWRRQRARKPTATRR
jgi:hypothetical protein